MSAEQSNLSNPHYGYDFVVATTQESINATMKEYLYNTVFPTVQMYWNQDEQGNPVAVSRDDLLKQTKGTDPLKVPDWNEGEPMSQDIKNINNSNFYFAFEASIGVPADIAPSDIPDIVTLKQNSQSVVFNLLCAEFTVVTCNFGRHGLTSYLNASQPDDSPWVFTSNVALKNIIDNNNLPPNVQKQLDNFGPDAFSVQQLIFDLDNAALESTPTISGIKSGSPVYTLLSQVFLGAYFTAMKAKAEPVLNYGIVKKVPAEDLSTFAITDMEFEVSPYIDPTTKSADDNGLDTLNYLCATNGNSLPMPVSFDWNWIEKSQASNSDGVISINRDTFRDYFKSQLKPYVSQNCFQAYVHVYTTGFLSAHIHYDHSLTGGQTPTITAPPTGEKVLTYGYTSSAFDQAGLRGDLGRMRLSSTYKADVSFSGNSIIITQNLLITIYLRRLANSVSWNPVNKTYTDTYELGVDQNGNLSVNHTPKTTDDSQPTPSKGWFIELFTHLNDFSNDAESWIKHFVGTNYEHIPVDVINKLVFPGGKTLVHKDVSFSDNQDLVTHITYVQPE